MISAGESIRGDAEADGVFSEDPVTGERMTIFGPAESRSMALRQAPRSFVARCLAAVLAAAAAIALRLAFEPLLGPSLKYSFGYPAVLLVGLYAGFWPGLFCMLLTAAASLLVVRTTPEGLFGSRTEVNEFISFIGLGFLILTLAAAQRGARARVLASSAASEAEALRLEREVDERGRVESALRSSEARLAKAQHIAHLGNWEWDLGTKQMILSDEAFRILGLPAQSGPVSFEAFLSRVHAHDRNLVTDTIDQAIRNRQSYNIDHRVSRPDGSERIVNMHGEMEQEHGDTARMVGTILDITERKRSEQDLRSSEARTRMIIESALDAVVLMDTRGVITDWNARAEQIFGWAASEAIGKVMAELIVPRQYRQSHKTGLRRFLATGKGRLIGRRIEMNALHRDGHEFPVEISIAPVDLGDTIVFSAFARDIQDRKRNEEALKASNDLQKMILSELNHRVRNNLAGLISLIDLSASAASDIPTFASTIRNRVHSMSAVHSMLSHTSWRSLVLDEIISKLLPHDRRGLIELQGDPVQIPAHQCTPLGMVIGELMANSIKYGALSSDKGRVLVAWRSEEASGEGTQVIRMTWRETDGPPIEREPTPQLGTSLIKGFLRSDLQGQAILNYPREGASHEFIMTLDHSHHPLLDASK